MGAKAFFLAKQIVNNKVAYNDVIERYPELKVEIDEHISNLNKALDNTVATAE